MANLLTNVPINLQSGTVEFGPANVQNGLTSITLTLDRHTTATPTMWPNVATTIKCDLFVSTDGGATWNFAGGFEAQGGTYIRQGVESPKTMANFPLPAGTNRKAKAAITVTNGPLVSNLNLTAA